MTRTEKQAIVGAVVKDIRRAVRQREQELRRVEKEIIQVLDLAGRQL